MTTTTSPSAPPTPVPRSTRRAGWSGLSFVVLLLLSAGMASVPGASDSVPTVRDFYDAHPAVVVVAQLIGLGAAAVFAVHARALKRGQALGGGGYVSAAGGVVAASAALTAVPVLVLAAGAARYSDRTIAALARASDLTDVVLFAAVSLFAAAVARASRARWLGSLAGTVAVVTAARSVLLACGSSSLDVAAPWAFIALVTVVSVRDTGSRLTPRRGPAVRPRTRLRPP
jgi:hypothetical protein